VGDFNLRAELDKTEVETGQPVTLKITISGVGNVRSITSPPLPEVASFRTYNSSNSENISKSDYNLQGTKTFEQILIPKEPGSFVIPPVEFSYFDVSRKEYKTLKSPSFNVTVRSAGALPLASVPSASNEISSGIKDIHYLKPELGPAEKGGLVLKNPGFIALQVVPVIALMLLWRRENARQALLSNRALARYRLAYKNAQKGLDSARQSLVAEKEAEIYSHLHRTLCGYLADKLNLPEGGNWFTEELLARLNQSTLPNTEFKQIREVLEACDQARFGGGRADKNRRLLLLEMTRNLIEVLEKGKWFNRVKVTA
jgi:hypothetical protein